MRRTASVSSTVGLCALIVLAALTAAGATSALASRGKKGGPSEAWRDDFEGRRIDRKHWVIANGRAPGYITNYHVGYYDPGHVSLGGGFLSLRLTQETGPVDSGYGTISRGALLYTKRKYGYGTYEWRMRMSSTAAMPSDVGYPTSGSVSAGFIYVNNSQTEVDFEFSGNALETLYMVNWLNPDPSRDPTREDETYSTWHDPDIDNAFRTYKFVWEPGRVSFYVDGVLRARHTTDVPSAPAHFMINHWGTDGPFWGGYATVGTDRYFHINWASYTPLP